MISYLKRSIDQFRGTGDASVAVPVFDGPLKPNDALEQAVTFAELPDCDDIAADGEGGLYVARGGRLEHWTGGAAVRDVHECGAPISAVSHRDGRIAVVTHGEVQLLDTEAGGLRPAASAKVDFGAHATDVALGEGNQVLVSIGSNDYGTNDWKFDLMSHGRTGSVVQVDCATGGVRALVSGRRYCAGVEQGGPGQLFAESWAHNVSTLDGSGPEAQLAHLPGYPARLSPAAGGGYWLPLFAARSQLIEFVLREDRFRREMMETIDPRYWIAPSFSSGSDFLEPLQFGAVKMMGIMKPWAPPRSYGVVIRLDERLVPMHSLHSRADGTNHGTVRAVESGGHLYVLAKGPGRILKHAL